jgi:exonuclease III
MLRNLINFLVCWRSAPEVLARDDARKLSKTRSAKAWLAVKTGWMPTPFRRQLAIETLEFRVLLAAGDLRIVNYNVAGADSSSSAQFGTLLDAIGDEVYGGRTRQVDVVAIQEAITQTTATALIVSQLNTIYGAGAYARGNLNGSSTSGDDTVGLIYNTQTVQLIGELGIGTPSTSGQPRQTIRYQLRPLGVLPITDFYLYNSHFKSSDTSADAERRRIEAVAIRANSDNLPQGTHIIYAGDFNLYQSSEPAYQALLAAGNGQAFDPINRPGNWSENSAFTDIFTQAPSSNPPSGLVGGGLDDRFDFQLQSGEWTDGTTLEYVAGSYRAFGNNGTVAMNGNINNASNTALASLSNRIAILNLLTTLSDHLPVVADFRFVSGVVEQFVAYVSGDYNQSFDGLPNAGTYTLASNGPLFFEDSPITAPNTTGWQFANNGGTSTLRFNVGTGSSSTGSAYSFGLAGAVDRALGTVAAASNIVNFGVILVNRSGTTLTSFSLRYFGEKWREGGSNTADTLSFSYGLGANSILDPGTGSFVNFTGLDFTSPNIGTTAASMNGNLPGNRTERMATVQGIQWLPEQRLVLRWRDIDDPGGDDGLSIDDLRFSASPPPALVVDRRVFYANSIFDTATNPIDAIDFSKSALLPGQTTSFDNYTNNTRGLNGLIIDAVGASSATLSDFQFATWNGISAAGFVAASAVPTVEFLSGGGTGGANRFVLQFADNAIRNTWLRVTVLANANTGLASNDTFYFGHAAGDVNQGNIGSPVMVRTNATDTSFVRQNQSPSANSATIGNFYDINKDGRVNASDTSAVRQNVNAAIIQFFTAPTGLQLANLSFTDEDSTIDQQASLALIDEYYRRLARR